MAYAGAWYGFWYGGGWYGDVDYSVRGGYVVSWEQVEEYRRNIEAAEKAQDEERTRRRDLSRRFDEALRWAYLDATDPEAAALLRAAMQESLGYQEPEGEAEQRALYEQQYAELASSMESAERFVAELERLSWEAERKRQDEEDLAILLLAI